MIQNFLRPFSLILFLFGAVFLSRSLSAQEFSLKNFGRPTVHQHAAGEKCGHEILGAKLEKEAGYFASKPYFEDWITKKIETRRNTPQTLARSQEDVMKIPVVVHIIHSGAAVGAGSNIPESQVLEQIRVLNEDFNRTNADAINTPDEFLPVAGSINIEFVLAKQDEQGLPTNGIVRVEGPQSAYDPDDAILVGQLSQWNPEEYLNIWVLPLVQPFIGYASFPISDLPGLNFPPTTAITDGVTVDYRFFGIGGSAISASLGRTATHEVGHFLGLRHIWGDGGCGVDDFVQDTPGQDNSNNTCNANPSRFSCDSNDMIQNYMDYTPDACMNIFTMGQVERFNAVLANSPRRATLINNRATEEPELLDLDLALTRIIEPTDFVCDPTLQPSIEVLNIGNDQLISTEVEFFVNGSLIQTLNTSLNLESGESTTLNFNDFTFTQTSNEVLFRIISVNDQADENPDNNEATSNPVIQENIDLPYVMDVADFPELWTIDNPDGLTTWTDTQVTVNGRVEDAIVINHYNYEAQGELDYLISPKIDLARYPNAQLVFEMAYGPYADQNFADRLFVAVSPDCGSNFDLNSATYNKAGTRLETSQETFDEFIPTDSTQFRTELFNLSDFTDLGSVRVAIATLNGWGNNIYLKNIRILPNEEFNYNVIIEDLITPTPISVGTGTGAEVQLRNTGNLPVTAFLFSTSTNGEQAQTFVGTGSTVLPGETSAITVQRNTQAGKNRLDYTIFDPNFDANGGNSNAFRRYVIVDDQMINTPWRQNFNNASALSPWISLNPEIDSEAWRLQSTSSGEGPNNVLVLENPTPGHSYWLGSPIFDLSSRREASLFFDLSAGEVSESTLLQIMASDDGGETYFEVWSAMGDELSNVNVGASNPNTVGDFARKYVNLTDFAGAEKTNIRLAAVLSGSEASDSPIYLDNFELFLSANPNPVIPAEGRTVLFPNPASDYFNLAFNLSNQETVNIQMISSTGALVQDIDYPQTLNQTYTFSTELFGPGVYILKITSDSVRETKRLIIN